MNTYPSEFYDPLYIALGGNMRLLQPFVDDVLASKYNNLQLDGFKWDNDLLLDFNFSQVEKEIGQYVMATYYDLDSPAIPIAREGEQVNSGSIPRMKGVEYFNEKKLRSLAIAADRKSISQAELQLKAQEGMFDVFDALVGGHTNSLTYQRHQMVSNGGLSLTVTNNARGLSNLEFSARIPAANKTTKTGTARWWTSVSSGTYSTEGSACDPIADLKALVEKARKAGLVEFHFEVQSAYLDQVLKHSKVVEALKEAFSIAASYSISTDGVGLFSRNRKVAALGEIIGAPIKEIDSIVKVQKYDTTSKAIKNESFYAFNDNTFALIPDGNIGSVLTVEPLKLAGGEYASYYGGKLLITISKDYSKKCMAYESEMTSLCVPDKPRYMWILHPYGSN